MAGINAYGRATMEWTLTWRSREADYIERFRGDPAYMVRGHKV